MYKNPNRTRASRIVATLHDGIPHTQRLDLIERELDGAEDRGAAVAFGLMGMGVAFHPYEFVKLRVLLDNQNERLLAAAKERDAALLEITRLRAALTDGAGCGK